MKFYSTKTSRSTLRNLDEAEQQTHQVPLKEQLSHYAQEQERKSVLKTLSDCSSLRNKSLDHSTVIPTEHDEDFAKLEEHVLNSRFSINGIEIGQNRTLSQTKIEAGMILARLCFELVSESTQYDEETTMDIAREHYRALIFRLSGQPSQSDAYAKLQKSLVHDSSYTLLPVPREQIPPGSMPLTDVTVYASGPYVHAIFSNHHSYGLYLLQGDRHHSKPLIQMMASVHERANLTTGASTRHMQLHVPRK